jgi:hypothetical protein
MTAEELTKEVDQMYEVCKADVSVSEPGLLVDELNLRCGMLARSAQIRADSQHLLDVARGEFASSPRAQALTATVFREVLAAEVADLQRLVNHADRLNSTLVHQIDAIRSMLSWEKMLATRIGGD